MLEKYVLKHIFNTFSLVNLKYGITFATEKRKIVLGKRWGERAPMKENF